MMKEDKNHRLEVTAIRLRDLLAKIEWMSERIETLTQNKDVSEIQLEINNYKRLRQQFMNELADLLSEFNLVVNVQTKAA
ncbi:MAG: hypothetical protein EPO28_14530 [Saprospiraceae bacterium]|nr:MAG: hypothetical protein EPO28_14530 [Saprospiraceae bacterium]